MALISCSVSSAEQMLFDTLKLDETGRFTDPDSGAVYSGWAVGYNEQGAQVLRVYIKAGFKDGLEQAWSDDGQLSYEIYYDRGQPQSHLSRWYAEKSDEEGQPLLMCSDSQVESQLGYQQLCPPGKESSSHVENCAEVDCGLPDVEQSSYFESCTEADCGPDL